MHPEQSPRRRPDPATLPLLSKEEVSNIDEKILARMPSDLANRYLAIPVSVTYRGNDPCICVAVAQRNAQQFIDDLGMDSAFVLTHVLPNEMASEFVLRYFDPEMAKISFPPISTEEAIAFLIPVSEQKTLDILHASKAVLLASMESGELEVGAEEETLLKGFSPEKLKLECCASTEGYSFVVTFQDQNLSVTTFTPAFDGTPGDLVPLHAIIIKDQGMPAQQIVQWSKDEISFALEAYRDNG